MNLKILHCQLRRRHSSFSFLNTFCPFQSSCGFFFFSLDVTFFLSPLNRATLDLYKKKLTWARKSTVTARKSPEEEHMEWNGGEMVSKEKDPASHRMPSSAAIASASRFSAASARSSDRPLPCDERTLRFGRLKLMSYGSLKVLVRKL